jgi:DNA-binding NarL/FixJ family response regulator
MTATAPQGALESSARLIGCAGPSEAGHGAPVPSWTASRSPSRTGTAPGGPTKPQDRLPVSQCQTGALGPSAHRAGTLPGPVSPAAPLRLDCALTDLLPPSVSRPNPAPDRDHRVLELTANGLTLAEIGRTVHLSEQAVSQSRARLLEAYGATSSAHVVALGLARGDLVFKPRPPVRVTDRQRDVLLLVAAGLSSHRVSAALGLAPTTASMHVKRLMWLFGVSCRERLVVEAYRAGVLVPDADGSSLVLAGGGS